MNPFFQDSISFTGPLEPREAEGITLIGPDFFAEDQEGKLLSPIASVFPKFRTIITVRGIHALHASIMADYLRSKSPGNGSAQLDLEREEEVYRDAVSLVIRSPYVLIRSNPDFMESIFAADELIQRLLPKERIQFTGLHLHELRKSLRNRGESWRMAPPPRSVGEIVDYVRSSRVQVTTGLTVYYNAPTGGRFLTYEEFTRIRPLLRTDPGEALARLREIVGLFRRTNNWGSRELTFFLPAEKSLDIVEIEKVIALLEQSGPAGEIEPIFDRFCHRFAKSAGPELSVDEEANAWHTTMFCRLFNINEREMEEWALGLSPEFHLNVKWLPGASVSEGSLIFDQRAKSRVRGIISHFLAKTPDVLSINIGRVEASQTFRDISGEERDVYLAVITDREGHETIRLVRLMKWDVLHRIKLGVPVDQAIQDTIRYRDYIFDRLRAAAEMGFPILSYNEIKLEEEIPGLGTVPVFFFDRQYVPGIATDKIPLAYYKKPRFIVELARLLGSAAAFTLVIGRASPRTGNVFFDDGDELVQLDECGIPGRLEIIETTGSFTNWTSSVISLLPQCLQRFRTHLKKAADCGVPEEVLENAVESFAEALSAKVAEIKRVVSLSHAVREMFVNRPPEPGGIRDRWLGILARLDATDPEELKRYILSNPGGDAGREDSGPLSAKSERGRG